MEREIIKTLIDAGIGGAISGLVITLGYALTRTLALRLIEAFEAHTIAISRQAVSIESLAVSLREFIERDGLEHKEMLILLKYMVNETDETAGQMKEVKE